MAFEIRGKIISVLDKKDGISKITGSPWSIQQYAIETQEQYPKKLCFDVLGKDRIELFNIQIGEELTVYFDIDAREYQGRWYNSFKAWKVERTNSQSNTFMQNINKHTNANENRYEDEFDILFETSQDESPF